MPTLLTEINPSFPVRRSRQVSFPVAMILAAGLLPAAGCNRGLYLQQIVLGTLLTPSEHEPLLVD